MSQNYRASTSWKIHGKRGLITTVPLLHTKDPLTSSKCDKNEEALYNIDMNKMDCSCAVPSKSVNCSSGVSNKQQQTSLNSKKHHHASSRSPLILVLYTGGTIGMQPNDNDGNKNYMLLKIKLSPSSFFCSPCPERFSVFAAN